MVGTRGSDGGWASARGRRLGTARIALVALLAVFLAGLGVARGGPLAPAARPAGQASDPPAAQEEPAEARDTEPAQEEPAAPPDAQTPGAQTEGAQTEDGARAQEGARALEPAVPTRAELEAARDALAASEDLEQASKEELQERVEEALGALDEAQRWRALADEFEREAAEAWPRIESSREQLEAPLPEPRVEVPEDATLRQLEERRDQAAAALEMQQAKAGELDVEKNRRTERRVAINEELPRVRGQIAALEEERQSWVEELPEQAARAREMAWSARRSALVQRQRMLEAELASYDARSELLPLRRQLAQRQVGLLRKELDRWEARVSERRRADIERELAEAERLRQTVAEQHPEVLAVAEENQELAEKRSGEEGLQASIERARTKLARTRAAVAEMLADYRSTRRKVGAAGLTDATGLLLRREYRKLEDLAALEREQKLVERRLADAQYLQILTEERREDLDELSAELRGIADGVRARGAEGADELDELVDSLIAARYDLLESVWIESTELLDLLTRLDVALGEQIAVTEEYRAFMEERILWVRSVTGSTLPEPGAFVDATTWLLDPRPWIVALETTASELPRRWASTLGLVVLLALLGWWRRGFRKKLRATGERVVRHRTDRYVETLKALGLTVLVALPGPLLLWTIGWALSIPPNQVEVGVAVGGALRLAAYVLVAPRFLDAVLRSGGLGEAHFRWSPPAMSAVRRLRFTVPVFLSAFVVYEVFQIRGDADASESVGRLAFVVAFSVLTVVHHLLLRADGALMQEYRRRMPGGWLWRFHRLTHGLAIALPAALVILALAGYYFTALRLSRSLIWSLALITAMLLLHALLVRWLFHARRKLAVEQARARAQAKRAAAEQEEVSRESATSGFDEEAVDIPALDARTRELFRSLIGLGLALGLFALWAGTLPALRVLDRVQIWPRLAITEPTENGGPSVLDRLPGRGLAADAAGTAAQPVGSAAGAGAARAATGVGEATAEAGAGAGAPPASGGAAADSASSATGASPGALFPLPSGGGANGGTSGGTSDETKSESVLSTVTLLDVGLGLVFLLLMLLAARNLPELLEFGILQRLPLDAGARYAVTTILRYLIIIIGTTATLGVFGIGWAKIQWLAAALTFGLAFGLQEIFANFVSGIIILIERPIRVGDVVTVANIEGRVTRLRMRATTILDWDRREFLVPNKEFITNSLVNWTLSDPITRLVVPVGIAYGSDTRLAKELLLKVAKACPHALADPPSSAIFRGFGNSSLDFDLRVFMADRDLWPAIVDDLHRRIDDAFKEAGIEIAFPQRDLHLRSVDDGVKGLFAGREPDEGGRAADRSATEQRG